MLNRRWISGLISFTQLTVPRCDRAGRYRLSMPIDRRPLSKVWPLAPALRAAVEAYHRRIPTGELNRAVRALQVAHPAPGSRIKYAVQGAIDPPTFTLFATARLSPQYLRYVERSLRERFALGPTPIKLRVRLGGGR